MFRNKVAVITGGALGIGKCITQEFAKEGAKVAFIDMNLAAGEETKAEIIENGGDALFFFGDLAKEKTLKDFTKKVIEQYGHIDYLINNAMISKKGILSDCGYDDFNEVLHIGITAPYMLTKLFLPYFNAGGAVVNISSTRAFQSQKDTESYTAAKGGITALTHALAVSLAGKIRVNSIAPGWIDTGITYDENYIPEYSDADNKQHPSERVGDPMDIVRTVFFLCHQNNSFINGQNITVDGGMSKLMIYTEDYGWHYEAGK
ncbi:MAG: SDR family oxidoreductase [Clostridiaceae bacterium]|nr:SDR family oxidoreductase [Clostridiaceae bacterium]